MGVPGWLLRIVASFLENRELLLRYQRNISKRKKLPGGGPQGSVLGMFMFLILSNMAGFDTQNQELGKIITSAASKRKPMERIHLKFIDDMTAAEAIHVRKQLVTKPDLPRPLEYHQRTEHVVPGTQSQLQSLLNDVIEYTTTHKMKVNNDKSKVYKIIYISRY